jgi:hypothetical protein
MRLQHHPNRTLSAAWRLTSGTGVVYFVPSVDPILAGDRHDSCLTNDLIVSSALDVETSAVAGYSRQERKQVGRQGGCCGVGSVFVCLWPPLQDTAAAMRA